MRRFVVLIAGLALALCFVPRPASALLTARKPPALATVRFIWHGLAVRPPRGHFARSKVKQSLYTAYALRTRTKQKASLAFRDSTLLHINQLTDAVLRSARVTQVSDGEVQVEAAPGSEHQIKTNAAIVTAIGTRFDLVVTRRSTTIVVIEGAVLVHTPLGDVTVRTNEELTVKKGQAPGQPQPANTAAVQQWTAIIPEPATSHGLNVALRANDGAVTAVSSQRDGFGAGNAIDGDLSTSWQTADGQTANGSITVALGGGKVYTVSELILDCAATGGQSSDNDLKDFTLEASTDGTSFSPVFSGACKQQTGLQVFHVQTQASAVRLDARTNWGGSAGIALAEMQVISADTPAALGTPTPTLTPIPMATPTVTPTATPTPVLPTATPTSTATVTPTVATTPSGRIVIPAGHTATLSASWINNPCDTLAYGYQLESGPNVQLGSKQQGVCQSGPIGTTTIGPFATDRTLRIYLYDAGYPSYSPTAVCSYTFYSDGVHAMVSGTNPITVDMADSYLCQYGPDTPKVPPTPNLHVTVAIS